MVTGAARVPGAAGRPAELGRLAGTVSPQPVERCKRARPKPFRCGLSHTKTHAAKAEDSFRTALAIAHAQARWATNSAASRALPGCGASRVGGARHATCSRPSTAHSPKAWLPPISKRLSRCWKAYNPAILPFERPRMESKNGSPKCGSRRCLIYSWSKENIECGWCFAVGSNRIQSLPSMLAASGMAELSLRVRREDRPINSASPGIGEFWIAALVPTGLRQYRSGSQPPRH